MTDKPSLNIRQIITRVRQNAVSRDGDGAGGADASGTGGAYRFTPGVRQGFFQGPFLDVDRDSFDIEELMQFHDRMFVTHAYQALLKRDPDPEGIDHYLQLLRSGRTEKLWILARFRYGAEGRKQKVKVRGLLWETVKLAMKVPPVLGRMMDYLLSLLGLRRIRAGLVKNEIELGRLFEETGLALARLEARIESRLDSKADKSQLEQKADEREMNHYLRLANNVLDMVCALNDSPSQRPDKDQPPARMDAYSDPWLDDLYLSFEEVACGPRERVLQRLDAYLPQVREAVEQAAPVAAPRLVEPGCQVLDLGCGRGAFLELLIRNGIQAMGVDSNPLRVQQCRERGLKIRQRDIFDFLKEMPAECMCVISGFGILERLPLHRQLLLMDHCRRILAPGGLLILEAANPRNIMEGLMDFYRDPTRICPVHPDALLIMANARGFARPRICLPMRTQDGYSLQRPADKHFTEFSDGLSTAGYFALLAHRR